MGAEGAALPRLYPCILRIDVFCLWYVYINKAPLFNLSFSLAFIPVNFLILLVLVAQSGLCFCLRSLVSSNKLAESLLLGTWLGASDWWMSYTSFCSPMMAKWAPWLRLWWRKPCRKRVLKCRSVIRVIILIGLSYVKVCVFIITQLFHNQIPYIYSSNEQVCRFGAYFLISSCLPIALVCCRQSFTGAFARVSATLDLPWSHLRVFVWIEYPPAWFWPILITAHGLKPCPFGVVSTSLGCVLSLLRWFLLYASKWFYRRYRKANESLTTEVPKLSWIVLDSSG